MESLIEKVFQAAVDPSVTLHKTEAIKGWATHANMKVRFTCRPSNTRVARMLMGLIRHLEPCGSESLHEHLSDLIFTGHGCGFQFNCHWEEQRDAAIS